MSRPPIQADLSGKTCIVTGANAGLGRQTALVLAGLGAHVTLACRNQEKGQAALDAIVQETGNQHLELALLDASSQRDIHRFAREFQESHEDLHILVNNAGIWPTERRESVDGIEMTWATNVLGYFLLTNLLTDLLKKSAPARIVDVASSAAGGLRIEDVQFQKRPFNGVKAYIQSKQANRMLAWKRAELLQGSGVTLNVAHPGPVRTELGRYQEGFFGKWTARIFNALASSVEKGADNQAWLAASPAVQDVHGEFFVNRKRKACKFRKPEAIERLWKLCESQMLDLD